MKLIVAISSVFSFHLASAQLQNVSLRFEEAFNPKNPFIECAAQKAVESLGPAYALYAIMDSTPVGKSVPAEVANLRFMIRNISTEKRTFLGIHLRSLDLENKWHYVGEPPSRIFLFSSRVSEEAFIASPSGELVSKVNLKGCQ